MKLEIDTSSKTIKFAAWAIGAAFTAYFAANALYIENHEMEKTDREFRTKVLMSESTRYAEVATYYRNEMKSRDLTEAEWARLELVEKQQCRIRNTLADKELELCD